MKRKELVKRSLYPNIYFKVIVIMSNAKRLKLLEIYIM